MSAANARMFSSLIIGNMSAIGCDVKPSSGMRTMIILLDTCLSSLFARQVAYCKDSTWSSSFRHGAHTAIARDDETGTLIGMAVFEVFPENNLKNDDEYCHQAGRSRTENWLEQNCDVMSLHARQSFVKHFPKVFLVPKTGRRFAIQAHKRNRSLCGCHGMRRNESAHCPPLSENHQK